jgi:hypothetical protein
MKTRSSYCLYALFAMAVPFLVVGCSSTNTSNNNPPPQNQTGNVITTVGDASVQDWSLIGVKVLSIALIPQGGGTPVNVFAAGSNPPTLNLVELDGLSDILNNASIPTGSYSQAQITISANPGDVQLTASADPSTGFAGTAGQVVPSSQIQIQGAQGSSGSMTVSFNVNLAASMSVAANSTTGMDLEFDLSHPAFIVAHVPLGGGNTVWAVNFHVVRHRPHQDLSRFLLRDMYATVQSVATGNASITVFKDYPVYPPTNPETAVESHQQFTINADGTDGTIFYDVDAKTSAVIKDFSSVASSLPNKFIRTTLRFQPDGTLVAVRVWASSTFGNLWVSPEGHVLHVNTSTDVMTILNESGIGIPITVNANTEFFFRVPWNATADATPIGQGPSFLTSDNLVRGFKVHVSVVDPLATPLVAQTVDIENARYGGTISNAGMTNFTYTNTFHTSTDNYTITLPYISSSSTNHINPATGADTQGFVWWNFTYPTLLTSGSGAISSFVAATNGSANFGGSVGSFPAMGMSGAVWGDPSNMTGWSADYAVLEPSAVPLATVSVPWVTNSAGGTFSISVTGGTTNVAVDASDLTSAATLVYQVDRTNGIVTISPIDITTTQGLATVAGALVNGTKVKAFGIPQSDGSIKAYIIFYYTGTMPTS